MNTKTDHKSAKGNQNNPRQSGGQPGNQNARKNGAYAKHFVTDHEREAFKDLRAELSKDFKKETGVDSLELDMVCLMALRHGQALEKGDIDMAIKLDTPVRNHLAALKATRASRKTKGMSDQPRTTPAEWVVDFLEKAKQAEERAEKRKNLSEKS